MLSFPNVHEEKIPRGIRQNANPQMRSLLWIEGVSNPRFTGIGLARHLGRLTRGLKAGPCGHVTRKFDTYGVRRRTLETNVVEDARALCFTSR